MAKQTTIPKVDENFMREVISQGFPMKKEILNEKGFPIARRTVAKYRQQLNIPVARLRK